MHKCDYGTTYRAMTAVEVSDGDVTNPKTLTLPKRSVIELNEVNGIYPDLTWEIWIHRTGELKRLAYISSDQLLNSFEKLP